MTVHVSSFYLHVLHPRVEGRELVAGGGGLVVAVGCGAGGGGGGQREGEVTALLLARTTPCNTKVQDRHYKVFDRNCWCLLLYCMKTQDIVQ